MGFFIVCDDTEREYGNDKKAADYSSEAAKEGWTAISMAGFSEQSCTQDCSLYLSGAKRFFV